MNTGKKWRRMSDHQEMGGFAVTAATTNVFVVAVVIFAAELNHKSG
jgi:hypothetical protein